MIFSDVRWAQRCLLPAAGPAVSTMPSEHMHKIPNLCPPSCVQHVADTWYRQLITIIPGLSSEDVRQQIVAMTETIVGALESDEVDRQPVMRAGGELEAMDTLQPQDVATVQASIAQAFSEAMSPQVWAMQQSRIANLLFVLAAGFYIGKSRRAAKFNVAVTSRMGHDLKTPINAITGFSRVMLKGIDGPITDFQREDLTSIYEAGQRLLTMINDLYAVQKQDAARTLIYDHPFAVSELMVDVMRIAQPLAVERDHTLGLRLVGDLGSMDQDPAKVRWVLLCLLCHVFRMSEGAEITLTTERDHEAGGWVVSTTWCLGGRQILDEPAAPTPDGTEAVPTETSAETTDAEFTLDTCRHACEELDGTLTWTESDDGGAVYTVRLPGSGSNAS